MRSSRVPPTISDVARRAGVSIATVSRVLNRNSPVAEATSKRVLAAIQQLGFVPRAAARGLASHRTHTLGLVLPEIGREFFLPLLRGIEAEARGTGYDLLIETTRTPDTARRSLGGLGEHNTDGLIIFTDSVEDAELARLFKAGFPMVLLHQTPPKGTDIPVITIENKSGAQRIVEHLIEVHDCRRIAFLRGPAGNEDSEWRERGYCQALKSHGIEFDPMLVASGGYDPEEAQRAIEGWLMDGLDVEAIFTGDDDAATGVLDALQRAGKQVPRDLAVVGFDDVSISRYLNPPLTTVRSPIEQVGRESVSQLVKAIRGDGTEAVTLLPTELVIRASCGCRWPHSAPSAEAPKPLMHDLAELPRPAHS
jgi:LacI family transcriptional regulator, galactose operon repressor